MKDKIARCRECAFYDPTPFPEYEGKLAKCSNPERDFIGSGKIGCYTFASRLCFKKMNEVTNDDTERKAD